MKAAITLCSCRHIYFQHTHRTAGGLSLLTGDPLLASLAHIQCACSISWCTLITYLICPQPLIPESAGVWPINAPQDTGRPLVHFTICMSGIDRDTAMEQLSLLQQLKLKPQPLQHKSCVDA